MGQAINCFILFESSEISDRFSSSSTTSECAHLHSTDKSLEFVLKNMYQKSASRQLKKHQKRM